MQNLRCFAWVLVLTLGTTLGCNKKDEVGPDKAKVSDKKEEVPEDFVLNPFLPNQGEVKGVRVGDAGVSFDGGVGLTEEPTAELATKLVLDNPGAEPRVVHKYAFAENKTEKRTATVFMETPEAPQPPIKVSLEATPKKDGDKLVIALKATKFEIVTQSDADKAMAARAAQGLAAAAGLTALIEMKPDGAPGEVGFQAPQGPGAAVARQLVPMLSPLIEILAPSLPHEAIGVGAKWRQVVPQEEGGIKVTTTAIFELTAVNGDELSIKASIERKANRQPLPEPPGATVSIEGTGSVEWVIKKTHIATKAKSESSTTVKQNVPGQPEQTQTVKSRETLEAG